jgi:hypothetical protein
MLFEMIQSSKIGIFSGKRNGGTLAIGYWQLAVGQKPKAKVAIRSLSPHAPIH